jgi:hypothetical protein
MSIHHRITDTFLTSFPAHQQIKDKKILDVGCGDAYASSRFMSNGASVVHAYDPLKPLPELCEIHNIPFFDSLSKLSYGYDIIWMHHVLEHVSDYLELLMIIRSLLDDRGELWMAVPNMASHAVFSPGHINNFMAPQLVEVLRIAGFAIGDISIWVHEGQLRVRVPKLGNCEYPEPMQRSLKETGRCASEILKMHNWQKP